MDQGTSTLQISRTGRLYGGSCACVTRLAFGGSPMQRSEAILVACIDGGYRGWQGQQLGNQGLQLSLHASR